MKKNFILAILLVFTILLSGCTSESEKNNEESKDSNTLNSISCTIEDSNENYKIKENNQLFYNDDKTLETVKSTVSMEITEEAYTEETFDKLVKNYEEKENEVNKNSDGNYTGITAEFSHDKEKRTYSLTLKYDIKKMDKETLESTEFYEYIDSDLKFDLKKFKTDINSSDYEVICTEN